MLEIRKLHAGYGSVEILRGIDLDVGKGEIIAVLGSNGVGKSTLNNNISALYRPFSGSIRFEGTELVGLSSVEVVKLGVIHVLVAIIEEVAYAGAVFAEHRDGDRIGVGEVRHEAR